MTKNIFQKAFPSAKYSGQTKTFFVPAEKYPAACRFVMHKLPGFRIAEDE